MKSVERSSLFTELTPEKATAVNGGYNCSKPWGAAYYSLNASRSYSAYRAYRAPSFEKAASRLDAVLFE